MSHDREVAGIRCMQVLEKLCDFLDGGLPLAEREQIAAHLAGCDWCTEFGGRYRQTVADLKRDLAAPLPADVEARLRAKLCG